MLGHSVGKYLSLIVISATASLAYLPMAMATEDIPAWAYPVNPPDFKPTPDDGSIRHVPDSTQGYKLSQVKDRFLAPDWHPQDHPPMPSIVAEGHKPDVAACGFCHRSEGTGGPENASLAGLPMAYIIQQLADYKSGARSTAVANRAPQAIMIKGAKAITDDEVRAAAAYFSGLKPQSNIKVVEGETAPKTFVAGWFLAIATPLVQEPIGQRIVEVPDDLARFESRDPRVTFTAYVPSGSISKGRALVTGQDTSKTPLACTTCHGKDLRGVAGFPSIAGRSPSYIFRQLYELQTGVRAGPGAIVMKPNVAKINQSDMIAIAAYLATLKH